jgi:multidrug efflux pump subunit AcrA (membrane-fusion protein)
MRYETGMVDLRATADADMQFNECKEKNNDRRESFSELSSLPSTLEIDTLAVADANCAASGSIDIDVTVTNPSTKTIASGAPVVVQANLSGQQPTQIDTLTTGQALSPGSQTTLTTSWTVPSRYVNTNFDVEAIVDPDGEVFACGAGTSSSQQAKCEVGG